MESTGHDPLCGAVMEEFFRLKAKEGNSGLAFFGFAPSFAFHEMRTPLLAAARCVT